MNNYQKGKKPIPREEESDYNVLMTFPSLEDKGGVVSFCRLLIENISPCFKIDHLTIGNRPGNRNPFKRLFYLIHDFLSLKKRLGRDRYDIIHMNPSLKIFSLLRDTFYLSIINKYFCGKTAVMFHGWSEELAENIISNFFFRKSFQRIYKKAHLILVLCDQFKNQLIKIGILSDKIRVVTTMYKGEQIRSIVNERTNEDKIRILFMARLLESKGVYIAAEVGRLLVMNGYKNFELIMAGDGPELAGLRKFINKYEMNKYISTPGYITGEEKLKILGSSDIFLYPSYYGEGCPVVILEAMGSGLAVISTPFAAIPEIVKHDENGLIVQRIDAQAFYMAAKKLIEGKDLLKKMQVLNKKKAEELYEAKVVTKKIESLYLSMIGRKEIAPG